MNWLELIIETEREHAETIASALEDLGAVAITMQDAEDKPIFEPNLNTTPLWPKTKVVALFEEDADIHFIKSHLQNDLKELIPKDTLERLNFKTILDKNWLEVSRDQFKPLHFGNHFWIYPSWEPIEDKNNKTIVRLDPGLAFGTGTHSTTALCLAWLAENPPVNQLVIDFGAGSGILSIAAIKLGAQKVYAIDHDPQALQSTKNNMQLNEINDSKIQVLDPMQLQEIPQVDLIVANILLEPIMQLIPQFEALLKHNGKLVLSGILTQQIDSVLPLLQVKFKNINLSEKENWVRISAEKA